ncbi:unnamed protein product [Symbiodinium sp. CCMP2592]|nr:unnamed protein product [Symbiodinium sp. CCMP2592]
MSSKLELLEAEASDTEKLAQVRRKIADPEDLPEAVEDPGRVGGTVLIVTCGMKRPLKTPSAGVRLDSDTDKPEGTRSDAESEDEASGGGDAEETGPRGAVRRAVRDLGAPRGAVLGASEPNSFGEVVAGVPLTAKKEYPLDAGMMVLGAFTGALGVPLLFLIWAVLERRKPEGGAFGKLLGASE